MHDGGGCAAVGFHERFHQGRARFGPGSKLETSVRQMRQEVGDMNIREALADDRWTRAKLTLELLFGPCARPRRVEEPNDLECPNAADR